ncbi:MAG: hypothetical protein Q7U04_03995, partial [Bacteriovorax sp.]|nr:hypothetical protein [Bacteriovorax sp.]
MNSIFKIKGHRILALSVCLILSSFGCVPGANIKVSVRNPVKPAMSVENVQVVNNQIIITGTNLNDVSNFKIVNGATITNLQIESKSTTSIVANTLNNVTFAAGVMFDFVLSTASATSTFQVTFTTANNSITATMLTSMGATKGQIMKYNGFAWTPSSITNAQTYLGTWNAGTNTPDLTSPSSTPGDYFIVSVAGTLNAINYAIGDWIISDGYNWQKVANSAVVVSTFNGRRGIVTMVPGDYVYLLNGSFKLPGSTLNDIANVDLTTVAPANNDVLKYNFATGKWIPGTVAGGGGAGTVTSVTSATTDIGVATGTVTPVLTLNSGTSANQIVKLNGTAQLPALDGSLVTLLNPSNLSAAVPVAKGGTGLSAGNSGGIPYYSSNTAMSSSAVLDLNGVVLGGGAGATPTSTAAGVADQVLRIPGAGGAPAFGAIDLTKAAAVSGALPIANGGTGATSAATARTALGVASGATYATGSTVGTIPLLGTGGIVGSNICTGDNAGGIICTPVTSSVLSASVSDESGAGALLFGTAPTITDPIIANISPAANFTLTQNAVVPFTSISSGAVVNTLYLK